MSAQLNSDSIEIYKLLLEELQARFVIPRAGQPPKYSAMAQDLDRQDDDHGQALKAKAIQGQPIHIQQKLTRIDAALRRIEEGRYGQCMECSAAIQHERLWNLPYAEYCYTCQQQSEQNAQNLSC